VRVAALYDVHGNLPALEAVLAAVETEDVDRIVSGGDVLLGPFQSECLAALRGAGAVFVSGNCEREVLAAGGETTTWCRAQLTADELDFVSRWPQSVELDMDGLGAVVFCHASPRSDRENLTRTMPDSEIAAALAGVTADVVVGGHTHVQHDRRLRSGPRLVNAGSVGMPYQGESGAFWARLGTDVELIRTPYDVDAGLASLVSSGFPSAAEIYEESIRGTVSAESASAHFASKHQARLDGR
jgi:putative phosphoesterase